MRKSVFGFTAALLIASGALVLQSAWSLQASSREQQGPDVPFKFHGKTWKNQLEFIDSGLRCGTKQHTEAERFAIDEEVDRILKIRGFAKGNAGGGGQKPPKPPPPPPPGGGGTVTIPVWFHVITNGSTGDVTAGQIAQQIAVLNDAFNGGTVGGQATRFAFTLAGVTTTNNSQWFAMGYNSAAEDAAKQALRVGGQRR